MFKESLLDRILRLIKKLIPKSVFNSLAPIYHAGLAYGGALVYGFPSRGMKIIGVTGTKGKSSVVYLITKILESSGKNTAAIGSLGFKIGNKEWPNNLKMTMPGRFKLQKFLSKAKKAGCEFVVLEVTSEGINQKRHLGINFNCAVFTNLHKEHLETHGSFENYMKAKQELFKRTGHIHVLNADDPHVESFSKFNADKKIFYGIELGDLKARNIEIGFRGSNFDVYGTKFNIHLGGKFNVYNTLAALSVAAMYDIDLTEAYPVLDEIKSISGRMEFIQEEPFGVIVDYAHTPDSLENVYSALKKETEKNNSKLICVLGAAGGGRDKWKRPEFGKIASRYCDKIILTDEDPYDENPEEILKQIEKGFTGKIDYEKILDRKEAIGEATKNAQENDIVIITGKGSETSMAVKGGKKIPWSDKETAKSFL